MLSLSRHLVLQNGRGSHLMTTSLTLTHTYTSTSNCATQLKPTQTQTLSRAQSHTLIQTTRRGMATRTQSKANSGGPSTSTSTSTISLPAAPRFSVTPAEPLDVWWWGAGLTWSRYLKFIPRLIREPWIQEQVHKLQKSRRPGPAALGPQMLHPVPFPCPDRRLDSWIVDIAFGEHHALILTNRGDVYSFGQGPKYELGHGSVVPLADLDPRKVEGLPPIKQVACGVHHSLALTDDGLVYAWGAGHAAGVSAAVPPPPSRFSFSLSALARRFRLRRGLPGAETDTDTVTATATATSTSTDSSASASAFAATPTLIPDLKDIVLISAGHYHNVALDASGVLRAWGRSSVGQLGQGYPPYMVGSRDKDKEAGTRWHARPVVVRGVDQVSQAQFDKLEHAKRQLRTLDDTEASAAASLELEWAKKGGSGKLSSVSERESKRLELVTFIEKEEAYLAKEQIKYLINEPVVQAACGAYFTAAVTQSGQLYTWGANHKKQLGTARSLEEEARASGSVTINPRRRRHHFAAVPQAVMPVEQERAHIVAAGNTGTNIVTKHNTIWQTGETLYVRPTARTASGDPLEAFSIVDAAAGSRFYAATDEWGHLYTWGTGGSCCLGHGNMASFPDPQMVSGFGPVTEKNSQSRGRVVKIVAANSRIAVFTKRKTPLTQTYADTDAETDLDTELEKDTDTADAAKEKTPDTEQKPAASSSKAA